MLSNISEINREISMLEAKEQTMQTLEKLALLYIVRDHNGGSAAPVAKNYSRAAAPETDFVKAALSKPIDKVMAILNTHMEGINVIYPKEYEFVMKQIREL